jgi:biofilm PGA synthesis lipoprotein PgaB
MYGYPSVLAVVGNWIGKNPEYVKTSLMNWAQIKEVANSDLVEIASHSYNLHRSVPYNPQGNSSYAAISRIYDHKKKKYETKKEYSNRIYNDLKKSADIIYKNTGIQPKTMVWPYGQYNYLTIELAQKAGFNTMLVLQHKKANTNNISEITRYMPVNNIEISEFIEDIKSNFKTKIRHRIIQADLDLIYDKDPIQQEKNLDKFIERIFNLKVSAVFLQAFCDIEGSGNISSVYFPNRVLPMQADLFNRVSNQLYVRGIQVYAWMPMLSIVLEDKDSTEKLRVRERRGNTEQMSTSWYERLSPFSPETKQKLVMLYEDLAAHSRINGIIFQDDGYLNDFEDFHPSAIIEYTKISGNKDIPYTKLKPEQKKKWTKAKTRKLIELTNVLSKAVKYYHPEAKFMRTLYAPILTNPKSEEWFAQNYADSLKAYDYVVLMSYPEMEKVSSPKKWLKHLVSKANKYPAGLEKTIFKIQAYDWKKTK